MYYKREMTTLSQQANVCLQSTKRNYAQFQLLSAENAAGYAAEKFIKYQLSILLF